jgi:hypothetical protein
MQRVISISALWRNDQPDGLGVVVRARDIWRDDLTPIADQINDIVEEYRKTNADPVVIAHQSAELAKIKNAWGEADRFMAMCNVAYLEKLVPYVLDFVASL